MGLVALSWGLFLVEFIRHGSSSEPDEVQEGTIRLEDNDQESVLDGTKREGWSWSWAWVGSVLLEEGTFLGVVWGATRCAVAAGWLSWSLQLCEYSSLMLGCWSERSSTRY